MHYYESGGVPLPRPHMRETGNTCDKCGSYWFGNPRQLCQECSSAKEVAASTSEIGYFRVVSRSECVKAAADEARNNGSILAFKGEVTCIMPKLIPGWTEYGSAQ